MLVLAIFGLAVIYASVGLAGASGYLAAMAFAGVAPEVMKPAALLLNVVVAGIGTARLAQAGAIDRPMLWPLVTGAVPLSFLGGAVTLPGGVYKTLVAVILLLVAVRLVATAHRPPAARREPPGLGALACVGAAIGLVAGVTGTGGGLFLPPLLLFTGWADVRKTAGTSAAFNLVSSAAGLTGAAGGLPSLPYEVGGWAVAAALGGMIGAELASRRVAPRWLYYTLAGVLTAAAARLALSKPPAE